MKFLDCITINPKISLKKGKLYPFIEMGNVSTIYRNPIDIEYKPFNSGVKFENGDTVIARITPCLQNGKRFYCKDIGVGFGSTEYLVFRPKNETVDNLYLYYFMKTESINQMMIKSMTGATGRQRVNNRIFNEIEVNFPDIDIQRKIGKILSAYDDLIENNQKQIKLLEEASQRLYKEWFVDLHFPDYESTPIIDGVPEGWKIEKLVDIADVQYGYAFNGSFFNSKNNGTPIIRIRNIPNGTTNDYTTEKADKQYLVSNGDIVVGMDGEFHINSWSGDTAYLVQRTCKLSPKNSLMKGWLLQAIYEPIKFFEKTVVGATVSHLGKKHIDTITLLTAPDELYRPFHIYFQKRQLLLNQNRRLSEARDRLLPKLMSRELEV
ncbi:MAG: restriction endonuclease subunit S [Ruminococcus sp.]|nr:restriction endonuclease subunit S [Ruminococcus sp.]